MSLRVALHDQAAFQAQIPCQDACPVGTDARGYVRAIAQGDYERAYLIARGPNPLASICGRVCGAPCEAACRRGRLDRPVAIRALKRTATERFGTESGRFAPLDILRRILTLPQAEHEGQGAEELRSVRIRLGLLDPASHGDGSNAAPTRRVAIVGAGPAGLACAHDLALLGHRAVVFDAEREPAGMLIYGIPEYRLPRDLIRGEVALIEALGVEFRCGVRIGDELGLDDLMSEYDAVVIAVGAKNSRALNLPGIQGPGVGGGVEFLRSVSLGEGGDELGHGVVVIGGGNVAYDVARTALRQVSSDVARTALRQGASSVTLVSLESLEDMPADDVEILEGEEEGLRRLNSLGPTAILRDASGRVTGVRFKRCLAVFDEEGRFAPRFDENDVVEVACDSVLIAIGQTMDASFVVPERDGVELTPRGTFAGGERAGTTTHPDVFVAGDAAYGPKLLIHAVASGKEVAREVHRHLTGEDVLPRTVSLHRVLEDYVREPGYESVPRHAPESVHPRLRLRSQATGVERVFDDPSARREASRCFDCGVNTIFDGSKCVLCGGCVEVCPESCLKLVAFESLAPVPWLDRLRSRLFPSRSRLLSAIVKDEELCIRCALCAERCPNDAITMERFCFSSAPQNSEAVS